jgi:hypothetical protein
VIKLAAGILGAVVDEYKKKVSELIRKSLSV